MGTKEAILEDIRENEKEIKTRKDGLKALTESLKEKVENTEAGERVGQLKDQLKIAQEDLVAELKRNPEVNDLMEEIGAVKEVIKGLEFALSNNLIAYFAQTNERQVQMDDQGHARDVLLSAKLGKEEKQYQESLFSPNITMRVDDVPEIPLNEIKRKKNAK